MALQSFALIDWPCAAPPADNLAMASRRDSLGRINANWTRQRNIAESSNADAMEVVRSLDPVDRQQRRGALSAFVGLVVLQR